MRRTSFNLRFGRKAASVAGWAFYCCRNLFADGGVPEYTWSLRSGQLPPRLSLTASPGRITGTPLTQGTFSFLMRVTDSHGAFAKRTFSITVS